MRFALLLSLLTGCHCAATTDTVDDSPVDSPSDSDTSQVDPWIPTTPTQTCGAKSAEGTWDPGMSVHPDLEVSRIHVSTRGVLVMAKSDYWTARWAWLEPGSPVRWFTVPGLRELVMDKGGEHVWALDNNWRLVRVDLAEDSASLEAVATGVDHGWSGLWVGDDGFVVAVDSTNDALLGDGSTFQVESTGAFSQLSGVSGTGPEDLWAIGATQFDREVMRRSAEGWSSVAEPEARPYAVAADAEGAWIVADTELLRVSETGLHSTTQLMGGLGVHVTSRGSSEAWVGTAACWQIGAGTSPPTCAYTVQWWAESAGLSEPFDGMIHTATDPRDGSVWMVGTEGRVWHLCP